MADMSRADLVADFKLSLNNTAELFKASADGDFVRLLDSAALAMSQIRGRFLRDSLTLVAGQMDYTAPLDIVRVTRSVWGRSQRQALQPWQTNYPNCLPNLSVVETANGRVLSLSREITTAEITSIGPTYSFYYESRHSIDDDATQTTINLADRGLLLLRAQVEACNELAFRQIGKPIALRDGVSNQARNATPAALAKTLLDSWFEQARRLAR